MVSVSVSAASDHSTFHGHPFRLCREWHEILAFIAHPRSFADILVTAGWLVVVRLPPSYSQAECFAFTVNSILLCAIQDKDLPFLSCS